MNVNNIWEIAEACQRGTLTPAQQTELDHLMATDSVFAEQFQESMQLLASLNNSGKQRRFKALLQDVHQEQVTKKKALRIQLPPHFLRITATAASVALIVSFINYFTLVNSNGKRNEQYNTISREVEHIKKDVQRQKEQQAALLDSLAKIDVQAAPRATVKY
ncbi:MAG: hypothetical protein EBZ77_14730, partial [Chitinophagia bacterium]|nr:hypothetical protein [Chitinophagia bacterium]